MNPDATILIGLIVLAVIVMFVLIAVAGRNQHKYDERQKLAQGVAYRAAFYTMLSAMLCISVAQTLLDREWFDALTLSMTSLLISLGVFAVVCICRDAYLPVRQNAVTIYVCGIVMILAQALNLIGRPFHLMENGKFSYSSIPLLVILVYVVILAVYTGKRLQDRRRERGEP